MEFRQKSDTIDDFSQKCMCVCGVCVCVCVCGLCVSPPYVPWLCAVIVIWLLARAKANWDHNGCRPGFQWTSRLTYLASTYFYTYLASWAHAHGPGPMRMGLASLGMPDQHVAKGLTSKSQGPNQGKPLGLTSKA